jgi:uncharacterized protein (DUF2164 family)
MPRIELDKSTRDQLARLIARRLKDELGVEVAPFDALDLMDYLAEVLGPLYYNQGLYDAQAMLSARIDTVVEAIEQLEQPVKLR